MMKQVNYNNQPFLILAALASGTYMIFHGRNVNVFEELMQPLFYAGLLISCTISLLIVYTIHFATVWLDCHYYWSKYTLQRIFYQFLLGIVIPALIDFFAILLYFHILKRDMFKSGFMLIDYPIILCMIVIFNLYYVVHYLVINNKRLRSDLQSELSSKPALALFSSEDAGQVSAPEVVEDDDALEDNGEEIELPVDIAEVVFFYRVDEQNKLMAISGKSYLMMSTLDKLEELYPEPLFFRINRRVLISKAAFRGNNTGYNTRKNVLNIYPQYLDEAKGITEDMFSISRYRIKDFKVWGLR